MAELPRAGVEETDAAVARAKEAFPAWRAVAPADRAALLHGLADALAEHREELAADSRRATSASRSSTPAARSRWSPKPSATTPAAPERLLGQTIPVAGGVDMTFREPLGVVGLIVPWNFPLTIASWKVAPALAAGNTIVLKPAELTPLSAIELERIALEAGLPEGVLNVVAGPGSVCGQRLVEHPDVAKIAFTGSTEVGRGIAAGAAATIKRVTLELGGKSANVVFADADLGGGRGRGADGGLRQRRPGLLRALADPRRAPGARRVHGGAAGRGRGDPGRRPARTRRPRWGRWSPPASARRSPPSSPTTPRSRSAARRPTARATGSRRRSWRRSTTTTARRARRSSARSPAVIPFEGEEEAVRLANDTIYGLSGSVWTRGRGAGAARRAGDRDRRDLDQLQHLGPGLDPVRRLQAVGGRPRARPRRARPTTPRSRTSSTQPRRAESRCQDVCRTRSA